MRPAVKRTLTVLTAAAAAVTLASCSPSASTGARAERPEVEATSAGPATAPHCGVERWAVKTGTDPAAAQVDLSTVTDTTVADLGAMPIPSGWSQDAGRLAGSAETRVYRVHATLVKYKAEADSDYHLVLQADDGKTMIAEIPAPACVGDGSPFAAGITHARKQFDQVFAPGSFWQPAGVPVIVTGVGFFDALHGQTGVAPNGIELHPVLDIQIASPNSPSPSAVPSTSVSPTPTNVTAAVPLVALATFDNPPVCEVVTITENSGNGPTYPVKLCGSRALPISSMIVDGAALPERNTTNRRVVFWAP